MNLRRDYSGGYVSFGMPEFERPSKKVGFFEKVFKWSKDGPANSDHSSGHIATQYPTTTVSDNNDFPSPSNLSSKHGCAEVSQTIDKTPVTDNQSPCMTNLRRLPERRYWMLDENCKTCFECGSYFTAIRRKHHCRVCGRIFCNQCSSHLIEGVLIGLVGPQRACSYCADALYSQNAITNLTKIGKLVTSNSDNGSGSIEHINRITEATTSPTTNNLQSANSASCSDAKSNTDSNSHAPITAVSNARALITSRFGLRKLAPTVVTNEDDNSNDVSNENLDLFPAFDTEFYAGSRSKVRRFTSPAPFDTPGCRQSWGPNEFHSITQISHDSQSKITPNIPVCNLSDKKYSDCSGVGLPMKKLSSFHSLELLFADNLSKDRFEIELTDQKVYELWSYIWAKRTDSSLCQTSIELNLQEDPLSNAQYTDKQLSAKPLQMIRLKREQESIYCVSGIVLVYWLVSNIMELKRCRIKGRVICQKFMDLKLLVDFRDPTCKQFRDDFTVYELKRLHKVLINGEKQSNWSSNCQSEDYSILTNDIRTSDEPDWLLEIDDALTTTTTTTTTSTLTALNKSDSAYLEVGLDLTEEASTENSYKDTSMFVPVTSNEVVNTSTSVVSKLKSNNKQFTISSCGLVQITPYEQLNSLRNVYDQHIHQLVYQDVRDNGLTIKWVPILIKLAWQVCDTVKFDLRSNGLRSFQFNTSSTTESNSDQLLNPKGDIKSSKYKHYSVMDIRNYVHIKKLLVEDNTKSDLFPGTIFTKCVTHKHMPHMLQNPRILILDSSINYQRTNTKMTWLESQIMQEEEYLTNCVSKILCLHPNLIFVSGTVGYLVKNLLLKSGITLFCNVKRYVLYRIARITGADVLDSIDRLISNNSSTKSQITRLGVCHRFEVKQISLLDGSTKFLTFIENRSPEFTLCTNSSSLSSTSSNSNNTHLTSTTTTTNEATIILCDPDLATLYRVKRCFLFILHLCYNAKLEMSFMMNSNLCDYATVTNPTYSSLSCNSNKYEPIEDSKYVSPLARHMKQRQFTFSPTVRTQIPFLASREGQLTNLYSYYTYVIDWPIGRKLNDLMKFKVKIMRSELHAMRKILANQNKPKQTRPVFVKHPFICQNLQVKIPNCSFLKYLYHESSDKRDNSILNETLTTSDAALYADFKAHAFLSTYDEGDNNNNNNKENRCVKFSRSWAGSGSLISGKWSVLFDVAYTKKNDNLSVNKKKSANPPENFKRLERSILDPRSYQSLSFLTTQFATQSVLWPEPCIPPSIASVEFYSPSDLPLGLFLEKFCFTPQNCRHPNCGVTMMDHVQRFTQTNGSVVLHVRKLVQDIPYRSSVQQDSMKAFPDQRPCSKIQMWLYCPICQIHSPMTFLSADTWHLSFVKFIDLFVNSNSTWTHFTVCSNQTTTNTGAVQTTRPAAASDLSINTNQDYLLNGAQNSSTALFVDCPHSAYKYLHFCFTLDRKLAIFKYQAVQVYEVVMPPSEICTYLPEFNSSNYQSESSKEQTTNKLCPETSSQDCLLDSEKSNTIRSNINHKSNTSTNVCRSSAVSAVLQEEATDILKKCQSIYSTVSDHIKSLEYETTSCELSAMLEAYLQVLDSDPQHSAMNEQTAFLTYLVNYLNNNNNNWDKLSLNEHKTANLLTNHISVQSINVTNPLSDSECVTNNKKIIASDKAADEFITNAQCGNRSFSSPLPDDTVASSADQSRLTIHTQGNDEEQQTTADEKLNHQMSLLAQIENCNKTRDWHVLILNIDNTELVYIVQRLINELKRWIHSFISDWNMRFTEYDTLMKRIEKNVRDTRKKTQSHTSTNSDVSKSPTLPSRSVMLNNTAKTGSNIMSKNSSNNVNRTLKQPSPVLQQQSTIVTQLIDDNNSSLISHSNEVGDVLQIDNCTRSSSLCQLIDSDIVLSNPELDYLGTELVHQFGQDNEHFTTTTTTTTTAVLTKTDSLLDLSTSDCAMGMDILLQDKASTNSHKLTNVTDLINLAVVCDTQDIQADQMNPTHPPLQLNKAPTSDHLAQSTASMSTISTSSVPMSSLAPSSVRRFIHTLLPMTNEAKVFDDPVSLSEHPQLCLCEENSIALLKRFQSNRLKVNNSVDHSLNKINNTLNANHSTESPYQLLYFTPDVYINDRELTSIIAYALTLPEYERKLVDLHLTSNNMNTTTTNNNNHNNNTNVQLGQSVLGDCVISETNRNSKQSFVAETKLIDETHSNKNLSSQMIEQNREGKQVTLNPAPVTTADKSSVSRSRHIKIQFADSSTNFFCCVYYASEFFRLRQLLMPNGDSSFIRSLTRCYHWNASGGKSGSIFMKTRDERFVIKELSSIEMKTFHEISQEYFEYLISAAVEQRLCVLSRILGVFHVGFKNTLSGEANRFDVLVMENLFHGRNQLAYIYDLKGSLRKRLVEETVPATQSSIGVTGHLNCAHNLSNTNELVSHFGSPMTDTIFMDKPSFYGCETGCTADAIQTNSHVTPVLLDQNLLNTSIEHPFYLRVHSKNALSHCLQMDTAFLSNLFIMDYSLLVGVDTSTNQLIIGLIDYLRKFTLDKRLEMLIKQTITSAQGPMPTIVTPDVYRDRFLYQLHSYFPLLPDQWYDTLAEHAEAWRVTRRRSKFIPKST